MPYYEHEDDMNKILALTTSGLKSVKETKEEQPQDNILIKDNVDNERHERNAHRFFNDIRQQYHVGELHEPLQLTVNNKTKEEFNPEHMTLKDIHINGERASTEQIKDFFTRYPVGATKNNISKRYAHPSLLPSGTGPAEPKGKNLDMFNDRSLALSSPKVQEAMERMEKALMHYWSEYARDKQPVKSQDFTRNCQSYAHDSLLERYVERLRQQMMLDVDIPEKFLSDRQFKHAFYPEFTSNDYVGKHRGLTPDVGAYQIKAAPRKREVHEFGRIYPESNEILRINMIVPNKNGVNEPLIITGHFAMLNGLMMVISLDSPTVYPAEYAQFWQRAMRPRGIAAFKEMHNKSVDNKAVQRQPMAYTGRECTIKMRVPHGSGAVDRFSIRGKWEIVENELGFSHLKIRDLDTSDLYNCNHWESWS